MWKTFLHWAQQTILAGREAQETRAEVKELRQHLRDLTAEVQYQAHEIERLRENEVHEREKMALRLENEMLKFERRLPRPRQDQDS